MNQIEASIEWLEHCNREYVHHPKIVGIQHAFNSMGEKKIGQYYLDGYVEWESDEGLVTIGYEFNGCRFHRCPHKCGVVSVQTDEEYSKQKEKEAKLKRILTALKTIQGCEWERRKKVFLRRGYMIKSNVSKFLGRKSISEMEILNAVRDGAFYGICRVDIETPNEVAEKYRKLNFPLIFHNVEITEEHLEPELAEQAKLKGIKFPVKSKSLSWNAKGYIGSTPLLQFYMQIGMKITNLQWAIEYQSAQPFKHFVSSLVEERIEATIAGNAPRGDRAKLVLNSAVG